MLAAYQSSLMMSVQKKVGSDFCCRWYGFEEGADLLNGFKLLGGLAFGLCVRSCVFDPTLVRCVIRGG